jgi:hypothetical protein
VLLSAEREPQAAHPDADHRPSIIGRVARGCRWHADARQDLSGRRVERMADKKRTFDTCAYVNFGG